MVIADVEEFLSLMREDIERILALSSVPLGIAKPPREQGVYLLSVGSEIKYAGKADGNNGLWDRLLRKHISGDDGHAVQRALKSDFPDRLVRREHIKLNVLARWTVIHDRHRIAAVEQALISILRPPWNLA